MGPNTGLEQLNPREIEILALIADGLTNRAIAQKLSLSLETIKWYNKQIFAKLEASSRTQAVSIAKKHRLLEPAPGEPASDSAKRYHLGPELGRGGMGIIYQAEDTLLNRPVALKLLSGEITAEASRRLTREAQLAASLNHPNIVSIFDAGEMNGSPFIVMELVTGPTLYEQKPETIAQSIDITRQICAGLAHAHAKGIIHRDLKPENIILAASGQVKILDFGLARSIASRLSQQDLIAGSVYYLAPEQALGQQLDARTDLYSLGVMLYEMLTGQLPFTGENPLSVISQHLYAPVVAPSTYRVEVLPFEPVILRLLAKNPDDRYSSALQVAEDLEAAASTAQLRPPAEAAQSSGLLSHLARGRLVGRRQEILQLQEAWARSQQGQGLLALVSGEPGIGKTRLANELIVYAQLNGAAILRGGCYEYEATTPYLPFMEAFREWVHAQPAVAIQALMGDTASELVRLAPEIESKLGPLPHSPTLPASEERLRLFDNVTRFLQNLAANRGVLIFLDDLHWADQGTLALLSYALRNLHSEKVFLLGAYREIELDRKHPLAAALVEWNRERLVTRISLERLTFEETSALLATLFGQESISDDLTRAMHTETEGNPFFIEEVVKALIEQGQIYRENNQWQRKEISELALPQSVKEAIGRRLNRLSAACMDVLHASAALGKEFDFSELAAINLMSEDRLLDALDEASSAQLIRAKSSESFAFTHDKIREVLYEEINPVRRKRLHLRIGEALEEQFQQGNQSYIQELAHHFSEGGDLASTLKYSLLAAEKASRLFALYEALEYYEMAREAADSLHQTGQLVDIYKAIGEIYYTRGETTPSIDFFQQALDLATDPEERGAIQARMGSVYANTGDARGLALIERALQDLNPATQANEVALATAMFGRYYHYRCLHYKAVEYLEQARQIAEPVGNTDTLLEIYAYLAGAFQHLTLYKESLAWAEKNIEMGQAKNHLFSEAIGYEFFAEDYSAIGDWPKTLRYSEQDRDIGKKIGAQDRIGWGTYTLALGQHGMGDLANAEEQARSAYALGENIGDLRLALLAGGLVVQALSDRGDQDAADQLGEQVIRGADQLQHVYIQALTRYSYAYALVNYGQLERALALYEQCEEMIRPTENTWSIMTFRPWLAQVYFELGRLDEAARTVESALQLSRSAGARFLEAITLRTQARLSAAAGDWDAARAAIESSITILDETGTQLELGRSLFTRGLLHQQHGDRSAAAADWTQALQIFTRLGALHAVQQAEAQLQSASSTSPHEVGKVR